MKYQVVLSREGQASIEEQMEWYASDEKHGGTVQRVKEKQRPRHRLMVDPSVICQKLSPDPFHAFHGLGAGGVPQKPGTPHFQAVVTGDRSDTFIQRNETRHPNGYKPTARCTASRPKPGPPNKRRSARPWLKLPWQPCSSPSQGRADGASIDGYNLTCSAPNRNHPQIPTEGLFKQLCMTKAVGWLVGSLLVGA